MSVKVRIRDGMGHMNEVVEVREDGSFAGTDWVVEILAANGCVVEDGMADDEIAGAVRDAWSADEGYVGDPDENGLAVFVERVEAE